MKIKSIPQTLGIDVLTRDAKRLIGRLARLKSTLAVEDGGVYREDSSYAQVHITTTMGEDQLDSWLYRVRHGCDYVGVFALETNHAAN